MRLNAAPLAEADRWLDDYRRFFTESLYRLATYVKEVKRRRDVMPANTKKASADRELSSPATIMLPRVFCSGRGASPSTS